MIRTDCTLKLKINYNNQKKTSSLILSLKQGDRWYWFRTYIEVKWVLANEFESSTRKKNMNKEDKIN